VLCTNVALLALSHHNEWYLTFSKSCSMVVWILLNILLLRLFQTTQTQSNQTRWRKNLRVLEWPVQWINWKKCSQMSLGSTPETPIHDLMCHHKVPKVTQWRNKCGADSSWPQLATHPAVSALIIPLLTRLVLVANLSRSKNGYLHWNLLMPYKIFHFYNINYKEYMILIWFFHFQLYP